MNSIDYKQFFVSNYNEDGITDHDIPCPPFNGFMAIHNELIGCNLEDIDRLYKFQCDLLKWTKLCAKYHKNVDSITAKSNNDENTNSWNLQNCRIM